MRVPLIALLTIAALTAGGVLAASGFSGDGTAEPADSFETSYRKSKGARALEPAGGNPAPRLARGRSDIAIRHLVTKQSFEVDTNFVLRIVCPRRFDPLTGGALSGPGLAITNSSRVHPESGRAEKRSWYVGVRNLELRAQRFRGTIVCVKGI